MLRRLQGRELRMSGAWCTNDEVCKVRRVRSMMYVACVACACRLVLVGKAGSSRCKVCVGIDHC